jgi:16S rRNA (cytosine1402-N4)-methyltransferase
MMECKSHISVLLNETILALNVRSGCRYVDGTIGRAGHTRQILALGGEVLGIDRDSEALDEIRALAAKDSNFEKLTLSYGRHGDLREIAKENGWNHVDGILLDLGVSSPQLDVAERGFSFFKDGPLDMRMDQSSGMSAADLVNGESPEYLEQIFRDFGEEKNARRIARWIVDERKKVKFSTTMELASGIERRFGRHSGKHPATRVFQALRMAVNDEVGELERALEGGLELLADNGRFAVITFESITDRIVKRFFASHVGKMVSLPAGGAKWEGVLPQVKPVTRKAVKPSEEEVDLNPRSRSAKLRAVEKIGD